MSTDRLRRRQNGLVKEVDLIDLTNESATIIQKSVEIIDLTDCHVKVEATLEPDRLDDFRRSLFAAFNKRRKQVMSLLRIARHVNSQHNDKFSKMEIDWALIEMADANEISISNGLVYLN